MEPTVEVEITSVPDNVAKILAKFDGINARFWGCNDLADRLSHEDPVEALLDYVQDTMPYPSGKENMDVEAHIREEFTDFNDCCVVDAYIPEKVSPEFIYDSSTFMLEILAERFAEEYGSDDGEYTGSMDQDFINRFAPKMRALVTLMCEQAEVWRCDIVGSVELSADEVIVLAKHFAPELFENDA